MERVLSGPSFGSKLLQAPAPPGRMSSSTLGALATAKRSQVGRNASGAPKRDMTIEFLGSSMSSEAVSVAVLMSMGLVTLSAWEPETLCFALLRRCDGRWELFVVRFTGSTSKLPNHPTQVKVKHAELTFYNDPQCSSMCF